MLLESTEIADVVRSNFAFSIDKFKLSGPDNLSTPWYGLFRSDNGKVVGGGSKTKKYCPHQTEDIIALTESAAHAFGGKVNLQCYFAEGHYVSVEPSVEFRKSIYGDKDNVFPRVMIRAGYDGQAFKACMGYFRDVCVNMSMLSRVSGTSVSISHTSGLRDRMDDLIATFEVLKSSWADLTNVIEALEAETVSLSGFLNEIYGLPDEDEPRAITIHRNRTEEIFRRCRREKRATGRGEFNSNYDVSAWEAYNAVQGYVQHKATRKAGITDFGRIIKASTDPRVRQAEALAMATLSA